MYNEKNHAQKQSLHKNKTLSFITNKNELTHQLIIDDNYNALLNLLDVYKEKIDVIYIDPPYGANKSGQSAKTNYNNAIDRKKLLEMLSPRLYLAKQLLSKQGVIFCSIDEKNQAYLKCLFDEIFDENNFVSNIVWQNKYTVSNDKKNGITSQTEYILCYAKNIDNLHFNPQPLREEYIKDAYKYNDHDGRGAYRLAQLYKKKNPRTFDVVSPTGKVWNMPWNYTPETFKQLIEDNRVYWGKNGDACPQKKIYLSDTAGVSNKNLWLGKDVGFQLAGGNTIESIFGDRNVFSYPKPVSLIKEIIRIASNKNSIILDFFAGSGTTGHATLKINQEDGGNRQFILCTNNEITATTPNGIAYDVTAKRLKRIMTGECYDGNNDFRWIMQNDAFGNNLEVFENNN